MSRIESLPADQRAVLALLLREGRGYDELSGLLSVDRTEVRRRAHDALAALGPADGARIEAREREQISDHLLCQDSGEERVATRDLLERSPAARAWALPVAAELRELAPDRVPGVPSGPRSSRRAGAVLLGVSGVLIAAIAAVVLLVSSRDGGSAAGGTAAGAAATSAAGATQPQPKVEAQVNLAPPASRKASRAIGIVLVQRAQGRRQIVAAIQGLPKPKAGGYGMWLYTSTATARWLGFFASQDAQGRLLARGELPAPLQDYREILVTRESRGNPGRPGPVFLRGPIRTAAGG